MFIYIYQLCIKQKELKNNTYFKLICNISSAHNSQVILVGVFGINTCEAMRSRCIPQLKL